jgi:hypothetical protein
MKPLSMIVLILVLVILSMGFFLKPAATFLAKRQLEKAFSGSQVHIGDLRLRPLKEVKFYGVRIKKQEIYECKIKEAGISYDLFSFFKNVRAVVKIDFFEGQGLRVEDISARFDKSTNSGDLSVARIKYNKAEMNNLSAKLRLRGKILFLNALKAQVFGGKAEGVMALNIGKNVDYELNLDFIDLDMDRFIRDFDLEERFKMSGRLGGRVFFRGIGLDMALLSGDLAVSEAGGVLTITDKRFLENMARTSKQSLDILVESFKDYHYNRGVVKLGMEKGNLVLDVNLNGEAGKRDLSIVVHGFNLRR